MSGLVSAAGNAADAVDDFFDWIKKNGKIVIIILGVIVGLYIIKLITDSFFKTKHLIYDSTTGETKHITDPHELFQAGLQAGKNK